MMLQNHRLSDLVSSYSRTVVAVLLFVIVGGMKWILSVIIWQICTLRLEKNCPIRPNVYIVLRKVHSGQRSRVRKSYFFFNPRKVKKTAPEMSKTIVTLKRYNDSLYILGELCSSARSRHVKTKYLNFYIVFRPAMASPKIWLFWNTRKVKKRAPEMFKTIVAIKRYNDSLYILGDLCSSARIRYVKTKYTYHLSLKKQNVNNCYSARFLGKIVLWWVIKAGRMKCVVIFASVYAKHYVYSICKRLQQDK